MLQIKETFTVKNNETFERNGYTFREVTIDYFYKDKLGDKTTTLKCRIPKYLVEEASKLNVGDNIEANIALLSSTAPDGRVFMNVEIKNYNMLSPAKPEINVSSISDDIPF